MIGRDLAEPSLVPGEQCATEPAAAEGRIDEADELVDAPVLLVVPEDAAVRDRKAVDLRDAEVTSRIATLEVVVGRGERLCCLDTVVSLALGGRVDDPGEGRVVAGSPECPEDDAVELGNCCH